MGDVIAFPLKLKYRNPARKLLRRSGIDPVEGTWVFKAGRFSSKARQAPKKDKRASLKPRMKAYWGNVSRG